MSHNNGTFDLATGLRVGGAGHVQQQQAPPGSSSQWAQRYSVENIPLGRGSFATVHKGIMRATNEPVAIKVMTKTKLGERALQMLAAEINILRTLKHPNVVCLRDSHSTERRILIVLEYCGGGDLGQFIQTRGPSPESTARHFMAQLASGLAFLLSQRLIHRDIKPQNLLLSENSPRAILKIADFGLARHLPLGSLAESMLGSPLYMAPEVLSNRAYDAKADLWSAGAVLFELLTAKHPFGGANQTELINNIRRNRPRLPPGITLSPPCIELLGMLLVPRPADRASLQFVLSCTFLNPPELQPQARNDAGGRASDGYRYHEPPSAREAALPVATAVTVADTVAAAALDLTSPVAANVSALKARAAEGGAGGAAFSSSHHRHDNSRKPQLSEPGSSRPSARSGSAEHQRRRLDEGHGKEEGPFSGGEAADSSAGERSRHDGELAADTTARNKAMMAPIAAATSSRSESKSPAVERDSSTANAAGGRDGEWGWNWGHGSPAVIGVRDEGPLPSLPALPFALGPVGGRRSFGGAEHPTGDGGGGGSEAAHEFTFDVAFAASPVEEERPSPAAAMGEAPERRSLGAYHTLRGAAPAELVGPDWTRRKRSDFYDIAAKSMESTAGEVAGAATLGTPKHSVQRCKSFPGEGSAPMNAQVEFSPSLRRARSGSGTCSRAQSPGRPSPEPVFYLGQGGSLLPPSASPTRRHQTQSPGVPPPDSPVHRSRRGPAGQIENFTPPSPAYFTSTNDGESSQSSPGRDYQTPPISAGSQPGSPQFERSQQPHVSVGEGPSIGDARVVDGGTPMLIKYPSFRIGGDSLLTIPEDSTGFVLVTRPSSISCEHGPHCECWAWSATQGGGGAGAVRSPSASYLAAANPYGGPGKAAAAADRRQGSGGAGPSFLGLGTIWNTAVNTFRGVAGAHARRASWPRRTSHANQQHQQQQRASLSKVQSPRSAAIPGGMSSPATAAPVSAVSSSREHQSPQAAHYRKMGGAGSPRGGDGVGNRSGSSSGGGQVGGSRNGNSFEESVPSDVYHTAGRAPMDALHGRHGSGLSSPTTAAGPQTTRRRQGDYQQEHQYHHHRSHSDPMRQPFDRPTARQSYPSGLERRVAPGVRSQGFAYGAAAAAATPTSHAMNHREVGESRRVQAAGDRAEVVGKRAILIVTLADKTAQEAMALELESPRDAHSTAGSPGTETEPSCSGLSARRRQDMLTESLSLYVKALAMLQAALPGVLVECEGVPIDELAAWNPLGVQNEQPQQHSDQSQRSPSRALLAQRAALVTKASWLKELFSQTLQRAEHCRAQASAASAAATATAGPHPTSPKDNPAATAPWSTLGSDGAGTGPRKSPEKGGRNGASTSDTAAIAVYRSAVDHSEKAAVCYLLGRSDTAVAHYVRACALLRLLALEPDMAFTSGGPRSPGCGGDGNRGIVASLAENERIQGPPGSGGWRARLLLMAEEFAERVERISNGVGDGAQDEGTQKGGDGGGGAATVPAGIT